MTGTASAKALGQEWTLLVEARQRTPMSLGQRFWRAAEVRGRARHDPITQGFGSSARTLDSILKCKGKQVEGFNGERHVPWLLL